MNKNKHEELIEGKLEKLMHTYIRGKFQKSDIFIRKENSGTSYEFQVYVPESSLGKKVSLFQSKNKNNLLQKLTIEKEKERAYQIVAYSKRKW